MIKRFLEPKLILQLLRWHRGGQQCFYLRKVTAMIRRDQETQSWGSDPTITFQAHTASDGGIPTDRLKNFQLAQNMEVPDYVRRHDRPSFKQGGLGRTVRNVQLGMKFGMNDAQRRISIGHGRDAEDMGEELRNVPQLSDCRDFLKRTGKSAVDVVADYLGMLWKHTIETIVRARGQTVVDAMVIRTVITVPAIWKGYARQAMEEAGVNDTSSQSCIWSTEEDQGHLEKSNRRASTSLCPPLNWKPTDTPAWAPV